MYTAVRLFISALLAVLLMSFAASASAQDFTIKDEATGIPCPGGSIGGTDVNGGCLLHGVSEGNVEFRKHTFGIESHITNCNLEYSARLDSAGDGFMTEQVLSGASCSRRACIASGNEPTPWGFESYEGAAPGPLQEGTEYMDLHFCIEPPGGGTDETCAIAVPFQSYSNPHRLEYGHAGEMGWHQPTGFFCELIGHWTTDVGGTHDGQPEQEVIVIHNS